MSFWQKKKYFGGQKLHKAIKLSCKDHQSSGVKFKMASDLIKYEWLNVNIERFSWKYSKQCHLKLYMGQEI